MDVNLKKGDLASTQTRRNYIVACQTNSFDFDFIQRALRFMRNRTATFFVDDGYICMIRGKVRHVNAYHEKVKTDMLGMYKLPRLIDDQMVVECYYDDCEFRMAVNLEYPNYKAVFAETPCYHTCNEWQPIVKKNMCFVYELSMPRRFIIKEMGQYFEFYSDQFIIKDVEAHSITRFMSQ